MTTFHELLAPVMPIIQQIEHDRPKHHNEDLTWSDFIRILVYFFTNNRTSEMNSLSHCNRPIPISVSRKRHDVRYLKGFGDSLRSSFNMPSPRILQLPRILTFLSCHLLAQHMPLMAVFSRLSNQSIGHKHTML